MLSKHKERIDYVANFIESNHGSPIALLQGGSRAYNLHSDTSDYDFSVIFIPSPWDTITKRNLGVHHIQGALNVDIKGIPFYNFITACVGGQMNSLELLWCQDFFEGFSSVWEDIQYQRHVLMSSTDAYDRVLSGLLSMGKAGLYYGGYVINQGTYHIVRHALQLTHFYETGGTLLFPDYREVLLSIKNQVGTRPFLPDFPQLIDSTTENLENALNKYSPLHTLKIDDYKDTILDAYLRRF